MKEKRKIKHLQGNWICVLKTDEDIRKDIIGFFKLLKGKAEISNTPFILSRVHT